MVLKENKIKISLFVLIFNILWMIRVFLIPKTPSKDINLIFTISLKLLIFVVFPYLYVKFCYKENPAKTFKLRNDIKKGTLYGLLGSIVIITLGIIIFVFAKGSLQLKGLGPSDLFFTFVFAAFMEEITFRGLILGKLNQLMGFVKANIITSLLFVFIHMPQFIAKGTLASQAALNSFIIIFAWSLIHGVIIKKSNSLWSVIIIHGIWDCAVHVLGF